MKEAVKVKLSYSFDAFLLHLIQDVTKRSTAEILNFFNELGRQVCEIGATKRTGQGIRKDITDYFPGTSIPFNMLAKGHISSYRHYNTATKQYEDPDRCMSCHIEIGFPSERMHVKSQDLDEIAVGLMEKALLGGEDVAMPPFMRPNISTPKMFKDLMDEFAGRPPKEKVRKSRKLKVEEVPQQSEELNE